MNVTVSELHNTQWFILSLDTFYKSKSEEKYNSLYFYPPVSVQRSNSHLPSACPQSCDSEWLLSPLLCLPDAESQALSAGTRLEHTVLRWGWEEENNSSGHSSNQAHFSRKKSGDMHLYFICYLFNTQNCRGLGSWHCFRQELRHQIRAFDAINLMVL